MIHDYFTELCNCVVTNNMVIFGESYNKLLKKLYDTPFIAIIPLDDNRARDGLQLREEYHADIDIPCSVLEVLIALSRRCEDQIMHDKDRGNRSIAWFWEMIGYMGLSSMYDSKYNEDYVNDILHRFIYHEYNNIDMRGCAFRSETHPDLSQYELWQQMNFHLNDIIGGIHYV